jgi:phage terminase large subunit-like protein
VSEVVTTQRDTLLAYKAMLEAQVKRQKRRKIDTYYPATGPLRRELYPQHMEFFRLGATVPTRAFMAGNRVGKTEGAGGYEISCHLTGKYPDWWPGRKFLHPVDAWAAGDTKETVRDIIQLKMLGPEPYGTGMIPGDDIVHVAKRPNSNGAVDYVMVKNVFGGNSRLGFKSYDQGREAFQGTEKHVVWLDEESNESIRSECVMRLMTTDGLLIETFTPLRGLTPIVMTYLGDAAAIPDGRVSVEGTRALVMAGWDDVPHLTEQQKERLAGEGAVHLRQARSKGVPSIGIGAIYPVPEEEILVDDFAIPKHWPKAYGLDVGWNRTAAIWGAIDRESDTTYLYSAHYQGQQEPSTHVAAINARGRWMTGAIDPASRGRSQKDGEQLLIIYRDLGLTLIEADNSRESGLYEVHQRLATGRLKVFKSLHDWRREYRIYRRDEKGQIVKVDDHLMDACVVGDTMVRTDSGPVRIADLVGREGRVISRDGALCRFIGARKTITNTRVVTVRFDDGSSVTCTPDHPFLTPSGWVRADCMTGLDAYNGVSQSIQAAACASKLSRHYPVS